MVAPMSLVGVLLMLFLYTACVVGVVWGLPLAEYCSYCIICVSKLGRDVEEVSGGLWSSAVELVNERLVHGAVSEGTHNFGISGIRELIPLLVGPSDVIPEAFPILLDA